MEGDPVQEGQKLERWRNALELPPDAFTVLHKPEQAINPITILATVDPDGTPHTVPFGILRAVSPKLLRLACDHYHDTYANLFRDGQVSVALLAPPNIAVSIQWQARVVKEQMKASEQLAILEIDIKEVKNDMMGRGIIESAVGFMPPEDLKEYYLGAIAELEFLQPNGEV
ncbi:MAG: pyridoxamine 5'-phosphate oxidase family protein [Anaerolineales bacterium]